MIVPAVTGCPQWGQGWVFSMPYYSRKPPRPSVGRASVRQPLQCLLPVVAVMHGNQHGLRLHRDRADLGVRPDARPPLRRQAAQEGNDLLAPVL